MTYFESNKKEDCNGCGVCELICPKNAIEMYEDGEGFLYPVINKEKCVNCGLCRKICPNKDYEYNSNSKAYIAINKNKRELKNSSSGGMFIILAKTVINKGGIVFGVKYDKDLKPIHDYSTTIEGLQDFQGSKYMRSDLNGSYVKVKEFLELGKIVLFTGTPCQCQGLRTYLKKDYQNLITCDLICHSNPSPKEPDLYRDES